MLVCSRGATDDMLRLTGSAICSGTSVGAACG